MTAIPRWAGCDHRFRQSIVVVTFRVMSSTKTACQNSENVQFRPEAGRVAAGGVSHRLADTQPQQARRATQYLLKIVSPSGLSILVPGFRSLTAPAVVVAASGLIPHRTTPMNIAAVVVQKSQPFRVTHNTFTPREGEAPAEPQRLVRFAQFGVNGPSPRSGRSKRSYMSAAFAVRFFPCVDVWQRCIPATKLRNLQRFDGFNAGSRESTNDKSTRSKQRK